MSTERRTLTAYSYEYGFELPEKIHSLSRCADMLCDYGPTYCAECESSCAYGRRFLQLARASGMTEEEIVDYRMQALEEKQRRQTQRYEKMKARKALLGS